MNEVERRIPDSDGREPAEETNRLADSMDLEAPPRLPFAVVGIGASAGGLAAYLELFRAMPSDTGMAFVLVQHLPPDRESMVAEILQRNTTMPVHQISDDMPVEPNQVYVIRPGYTLTLSNGRLRLGERLEKPRHSRPVDDFFRSLAKEQRERAIGVIMSGMGSNGAAGAQAVKAVGGLCVAQDPGTAEFPSMPRHLIDAGYADFILRPSEMPEAILAYVRHPYVMDSGSAEGKDAAGGGSPATPHEAEQREQQQIREILAIVRTRTRCDFTGYKKPTVLRRIQRRMGLNRLTELGTYAKFLRQNAIEVGSLADDLLIHVTGFFRDPDAWEALRQRVIVPLVRSCQPEATIRCWVVACSSGEEAYSLAILLVEESERTDKQLNIKVFATDTAERTLSNARNGVYPGGIESELSPERLQRFFERDDAVYRVRQDLRECVVFAPQNVLSDPPFSRLDIVTCRNLLIYLEPEVQARVFALVHFGLREGGALFLGNSETVPVGAGTFEAIDKKARIYKRVGPTHHGTIDLRLPRAIARDRQRPNVHSPLAPPSVAQLTARALIALHVPAAVTVDRNYHVVYYQGDTQLYLSQPTGEPTQDLIALANEHVRGAVRTALQRAMASGAVEVVPDAGFTDAVGQRHCVLVTASPLALHDASDLFVVSFQRLDAGSVPIELGDDEATTEGGAPSEELQRLRDELQSAIEELQASAEEHKAAAEEAMSMNEELQSSNEELETSKEEMQSLNEELSLVNAHLRSKMDELQKASGDLRSLLASTNIAVIFLDSQFRIRRYTPAARNLVELIGSDVGRPLSDMAKKFVDPDLLADSQLVLEQLVPAEREVRGNDGCWYTRRVLPYRTADDRIEGVVVTFVDITDRKRAEDLAARPRRRRGQPFALRANSSHAVSSPPVSAKEMLRVFREVLAAALELHGTELADVRLYDRNSGTLQLTVQRGFSEAAAASWQALSFSDLSAPPVRALREHRSIAVADNERELAPGSTSFFEQCQTSGVRALHCFPLVARNGEILGTLTVYFREPRQPDDRATRITELLARQGADITERMRIEEERARLLRSEQLARRALDDAALMKDEFLAMLSHELRTPLSAILLWGRMIRNAAIGSDELMQGIDAILSSAETQARLIDDLLESSRTAAGKLQLELGETDLVELVRSVIEQNEPAARAKNLRVESDLSPAAGVVMADGTRIRQVVWNLLINAVKFTPEEGVIRVSLSRVEDEVQIRISDTGAGISAEFLPNVFDRFRQYEASITRRYGGLGLGFTISKQLVEMHGGTIRAESAGLGRGATFTVTLPLRALRRRKLERSLAPNSAWQDGALDGWKILLVEDDPETRAALAALLRQAGAQVSTAATGAAALAAYVSSTPQILLGDLGLPDFDGYALLDRIRAIEREQRLPNVPAVALSAYAREKDRVKSTQAGYSTHLAKPVDADELIGALLGLLSGGAREAKRDG